MNEACGFRQRIVKRQFELAAALFAEAGDIRLAQHRFSVEVVREEDGEIHGLYLQGHGKTAVAINTADARQLYVITTNSAQASGSLRRRAYRLKTRIVQDGPASRSASGRIGRSLHLRQLRNSQPPENQDLASHQTTLAYAFHPDIQFVA